VTRVALTGSTNTDLLAAAAAGAPDRSVLVADHQTAGRGRLDRRWEAPPGANVLMSVLFRQVPQHPTELTHRLALAAAAACRRVAGVEAVLKWPNDLLVDDRKLAGVLAQRAPEGSVVVGLGLNVRWSPAGATWLGEQFDPVEVVHEVLVAYDELPDDVGDLYRASLATLGRRVRVEVPAGVIVGRALDVADDGRLVVLDECGVTHRLDVGDVIHLRDATPT
jgi:BirA family transcriptional regulator, biotin operon repressor / biotin---[acetyl-CoA-carboxylase] ligase